MNSNNLNNLSVAQLVELIHREDAMVQVAVNKALPQIEALAARVLDCLQNEGRLFYIGAGTSGRLGVLDAAELPPTYGVDKHLVTAVIAGGEKAIQQAIEGAEDDTQQGWIDLQNAGIRANDFLIGIAASGTTPYVLSALEVAMNHGVATGCITCNKAAPLASMVQYPIVVETGAEIISGSTRMKAATAQKMVLNMISTIVMIKLGRTDDNKMIYMQLKNKKLIDRGINMIMNDLCIDYATARALLLEYKSVFLAKKNYNGFKKL